MRALPTGMQAALDAGVTTLAWCWRTRRRDGVILGFTDHDRDLAFDGVTYAAGRGWAAGAVERGLGLAIDQTSVLGALASDAIAQADVAAGRWDGAEVACFRVDWTDPARRVRLWTGRIARLTRRDHALEAELEGLQAALNAPVGRIYARACDADLGDARCGASLAAPSRRALAVCAPGVTLAALVVTGAAALDEARLSGGQVRIVGGAAAGQARRIAAAAPDGATGARRLTLDAPLGVAPAPGDAVEVTIGCDKTFETCRGFFDNALNFRGFPHMPGNDALAAGPPADRPLDGGRR